jgi:MFS family permease
VTARSSFYRLLAANRPFRRLWFADLASLFGDWFNTIALYTAVDALLGTSRAVGWVVIAKSLPVLLASPLAGPLVDALPRRRLMIQADLARALLGLVLLGCWWLESVPGLFVCTVLQVLAAGVFLPAKNAAIPALVGSSDLGTANALSGATWSVALALGAAVGGIATDLLGVSAAFLIDALTFVISAWLLRDLPPLEPEGRSELHGRGFVAGLRYLGTTPGVPPLILLKSGMAFTAGVLPMLTVYGNRVLSDHPAPWIVGLLFASRGFGAALGSFGGLRLFGDGRRQLERAALLGFVVLALGYVGLGHAPTLWTCAVALMFGSIGNALIWVSSNVLIQRGIDPRYLGRAFSIDFGLMTVVGAGSVVLVTGLVDAGQLTPRGAVVLVGLLAIPPGCGLWLWLRAAAPPGAGRITARS